MGRTEAHYIEAAKRALVRAYEGECHKHFSVIESNDSGAEGVYRKGGALYFVTLAGCSCRGSDNGRTGNLCRHQLSLADLTGQLDKFVPGCYGSPASPLKAGRTLRYTSTGLTAYIEDIDWAAGTIKLTTSQRVGRLEHFTRALETGRVEFVA